MPAVAVLAVVPAGGRRRRRVYAALLAGVPVGAGGRWGRRGTCGTLAFASRDGRLPVGVVAMATPARRPAAKKAAPDREAGAQLKVLTLNVFVGPGTEGRGWLLADQERLQSQIRAVRAVDADIICLQARRPPRTQCRACRPSRVARRSL